MRTHSGSTHSPELAERQCQSPEASSMAVHFSSRTDEWATPLWLFNALNREFAFTLDPCSSHENATCARHFTPAENGLVQSWANEVVWMNPPYGRTIGAWVAKAHESSQNEQATVVCLLPARTDTRWWHRYAMKHEVRLLRGRLNFSEASTPAPFPSAIVVMRPKSFRLVSFVP